MLDRKTKCFNTVAIVATILTFLLGCHETTKTNDSLTSKEPTTFTHAINTEYKTTLPFKTDVADLARAERGLIARVAKGATEPLRILKVDGSVVWDMGKYSYIGGNISDTDKFPSTVNPSLWRQAILNTEYGLYEVASSEIDGETRTIYQVRGYDIANMAFVETNNGFIAVDALSYKESATAAVKLFYDYLPQAKQGKYIHTVIYTHSHGDHYGGIQGILESGKTTGTVSIIAPDRFFEEAISENVTVGPAMLRRARWMYGFQLWTIDIPEGRGQVNNGLAIGSGNGTMDLLPPTATIDKDGQIPIDGTIVEFLLAPHTEAPASLAMFFPEYKSICLGELCSQSQHNILTPRGAQVRDAMAWSNALTKIQQQWVDTKVAESAWGMHLWPRWGNAEIAEYVGKHSKMYRSLHDGTVALMNEGNDMLECAELFQFPPEVASEWFNRGYYGATVHNVKAVYQKYLGWFDNNPVNLWRHPGKASADRYAKYLPKAGGNLLKAAQAAYDDGDYRWAVEALDYIRLAPDGWGATDYRSALILQADAFEQMAYSAESGIWRNYYLTGAWRNRLEVGTVATKEPTAFTKSENAKYKNLLPFKTDTADALRVKKGFIARVPKGATEPLRIEKADGSVIWDMSRYSYINGDISDTDNFPDTVNPSLWRQAILNNEYGLFEAVTSEIDGEMRSIYQVRGYDIANMSFIETQNGFIVVDVTTNEESAAMAVELFYDYLPEHKQGKAIHTVIFTHSHIDHFGGIQGVLKSGKTTGTVSIVAPENFFEEAVSENVTVGPAMLRRAGWMYGMQLWAISIPEGRGQVNNGLAIGSGNGTTYLEPPNVIVTKDGRLPFDGTNVDFILAPHTEAPASLVMFFPDYKSICLGELVNQTQHNILTPRGAQVRDTLAWSNALDKMAQQWVNTGLADSAFGSHHWPRWGKEDVAEIIDMQSKLYRSLHDGTVALMNAGYDMLECAELFEFPAEVANKWFNRGYYGATVHNVKAVYQKYIGWFDNNPANLWRQPGKVSAGYYAKYLPQSGGSLVKAAKEAYGEGNYRWVVEVLDHVRLAPTAWGEAEYTEALALQADAFEQMAYSVESGIWRNYFLAGAWRNRDEGVRNRLDADVN
ncbi:MAG: MBL fold metallo-hydrolase [Holophagaceae bacterium]|nr:MBL fold metallo-hydrolase [Holophagaceae bacterium]